MNYPMKMTMVVFCSVVVLMLSELQLFKKKKKNSDLVDLS